jgi:hypothetical protein
MPGRRKYGRPHRRIRAKYEPMVAAGRAFCARCGLLIPPDPSLVPCPKCGRRHRCWDLGHSDFDRRVYTGPEHLCCNRATAKHQKLRRYRASKNWSGASRAW